MKCTKLLAFTIGAAITIGSLFTSGCHDESKKLDKCLAFAKTAGPTVGYVINTSAATLGPEIKDAVAVVTTAIVTELPTNVAVETIAVDLRTISTNAVHKALPDLYEKYPQLIDESIDTLLGFLQIGLTSISEKYPTEFNNAEMFYKIAYAFFDSVHSIVAVALKDTLGVSGKSLTILQINYDDVANAAKTDGKAILSKADFEALMAALKK